MTMFQVTVSKWENGDPTVVHTASCGDDEATAYDMLVSRGFEWVKNSAYGAKLEYNGEIAATYNHLDGPILYIFVHNYTLCSYASRVDLVGNKVTFDKACDEAQAVWDATHHKCCGVEHGAKHTEWCENHWM